MFTLVSVFIYAQGVLSYHFENTLAETNGHNPTLTTLGTPGVYILDTLNEVSGKTKIVYRFEKNCGFQFDNTIAGNFLGTHYSIEIYFVFDELSSWKRVIDWKNRKSDNGAYVYDGKLNFYNHVYSDTAAVEAGQYTYYVLTRDSVTQDVLIYTDAKVEATFTDFYNDAVLDSDNVLNFFYDDFVVPNEASSGAVALLNIYNYVLDTTTIKNNWKNINGQVFGVRDHGKNNRSLAVFPSPAKDKLTIRMEAVNGNDPVKVSLVSPTGITLFSGLYNTGNNVEIDLNSLSLSGGIYLVRAESGGNVYSRKVVVNR
jgi:hypothetical protein